MTRDRQPIRQRACASRLRSVALVAVLAIAASAALPLLHGATGHLNECAVCSVFAHNGTSAADVAAQADVTPVLVHAPRSPLDAVVAPRLRPLDASEARAPPVPSVSI